ncbi:DUF2332 domain-containing protein [Nesterenkonia rhizosphaerae]|uniref:DUF2332 domain-containing protein n=1 Tax=Nesterenkonia rhizosphaerae TaxID=1348272 RepID=A0ABP9FUV4_9MICC
MREMPADDASSELREYYRHFAQVEAAPVSPLYQDWAEGVAADAELLEKLLQLPAPKRQANLLFAAARIAQVPLLPWAQVRQAVLQQWDQIRHLMLTRRTQTNEAGRLAVLNLAFSRIAEQTRRPLALLEVGSSAGLCLYPDAWPIHYRFTDTAVDASGEPVDLETGKSTAHDGARLTPRGVLNSAVELTSELTGIQAPEKLPEVAWRGGIDVNPLDLRNPEDLDWLKALVWPGMEYRLKRLEAGAQLVSEQPPRIFTGDLNELLPQALAEVPEGAVPVVFHSAVLVYLSAEERAHFVEQVQASGVRWVSNEGLGVFPQIAAKLPREDPDRSGFILALDGEPLARTGPHGQYAKSLE